MAFDAQCDGERIRQQNSVLPLLIVQNGKVVHSGFYVIRGDSHSILFLQLSS